MTVTMDSTDLVSMELINGINMHCFIQIYPGKGWFRSMHNIQLLTRGHTYIYTYAC